MSETQTPARKRRTRNSGPPKPVFVFVQVLDEQGKPQPFDKKRLKVVAVERSFDKVVEAMEATENSNAFHIRITVPSGVQRPPRTTPAAVPNAA